MSRRSTISKLLVASDFSAAANAALSEAANIANSCHASIAVANVIANPRGTMQSASLDAKLDLLYGEGSDFYREVLADAQRRLLSQIASVPPGEHSIRSKTLLGTPYVEICRMAQHGTFDLVVLGKHSQSVWKSLFVGSTAKQVVRFCTAPVLVVGKERSPHPKRFLVAIDFSDASRQACSVALSFAQSLGAIVDLLHVVDARDVPPDLMTQVPLGLSFRKEVTDEAEHRLNEFVEAFPAGRIHKAQIAWGTPWKEICAAAEQQNVDWIVTGTVGRKGLGAWHLGSTAEQVLSHCECSLLVVKEPGFRSPIPLVENTTSIADQTSPIS
jgi:nucleotide-binding universal stress UspA family protein